MKTKIVLLSLFLLIIASSCSKSVDFTPEFIAETSGKYLYNQDDVIEVFYNNQKLFLKWRGDEKIEPVVLGKNTFFVVDMYKKLQFVKHPETKTWCLSIIPENENDSITYDFMKVDDTFKTPNMHLMDKEYDKAIAGYLEIKKKDSTSIYLDEGDFNRLGYEFLRKKEYSDAIGVFKLNVALHPESDNVYDSLADAYLRSGDSLQAFNNYTKALEYDSGNRRAKQYTEAYNKKKTK